jgi:hypothetical protein
MATVTSRTTWTRITPNRERRDVKAAADLAADEFRKQANAPDMEEPKHMEVKRYDATDGGPLF